MPFDAANQWLRSRVTVPTTMTSAEIALAPDFGPRVRAHSFFSAQTAAANALEDIRRELSGYVSGNMDLATARANAKTALVRRGYAADDVGMSAKPPAGMSPEEWQQRKAITNLASTRRLNLILNQNARMAWAVGRKQVSEDPAVAERWPNYEYLARDDGAARDTHAALDGMVLPKSDPFWHTHTPPWEFNCRCDIEDSDAEATGSAVPTEHPDGSQTARIVNPATGAATEILPPESGFVFRSDDALRWHDLSRVDNPDLRRRMAQRLKAEFGDQVSVVGDSAWYLGPQGPEIGRIYDLANQPGSSSYEVADLGPVDGRTGAMIHDARPEWDLDGKVHAVSTNDFRHMHRQHGPGNETAPDQIPLDREDYLRISSVIEHPDDVLTSGARDSVVLTRRFPDGTLYYVEQVQQGKGRLMSKTMWKKEPDGAQRATP